MFFWALQVSFRKIKQISRKNIRVLCLISLRLEFSFPKISELISPNIENSLLKFKKLFLGGSIPQNIRFFFWKNIRIFLILGLQSLSEYFETFWCFTKFSFHHKWKYARLLLRKMVYTNCFTSCQTTSDLNTKKESKLHRMTA